MPPRACRVWVCDPEYARTLLLMCVCVWIVWAVCGREPLYVADSAVRKAKPKVDTRYVVVGV